MHKLISYKSLPEGLKSCAGYSLIQIAIGMVVLGIFVSAAGHSYILYSKNKQIITTQERVQNVVAAIQGYRQNYGRYPCPAEMDIDRSDANYGRETNCADKTQPIGSCLNGLCIEKAIDGSSYTLTNNLVIPAVADRESALADPRVRVGAIPFRLLQIDEKITYDAYGSRLLYAMTESLADPISFRELNGAVHIVNAQGDSLIDPPGSAPFVILSPGPNNLGAYAQSGAQISPCSGVTLDAENCRNFDLSSLPGPPVLPAMPHLAIYASDYKIEGAGLSNFDDTIEYFVESASPKWKRTTGDIENIEALVDQSVGIDIPNPVDAFEIPLGVIDHDHDDNPGTAPITNRGGLRATEGVMADQLCDRLGSACFDPLKLASPSVATDGISCASPSEYMVGISGGNAQCDDVRVYCTNNAFPILRGINPDGSPNCIARPLLACNANVQLCSGSPLTPNLRNSDYVGITNPISLTGSHGQIVLANDPASYSFNPRTASFRCNNGVWQYYNTPPTAGQTGLCSCTTTPAVTTRAVPVACPGQSPSGNAAIQNQTWNVAACAWGNSGGVDYTACLCPGPTTAQPAATTSSCGVGYNTGNNTTTYTFNNANNICNWQPSTTSGCGCNPALEGTTAGGTRTLTTPVACNTLPGYASFTGNAYVIQTFNAALGQCRWNDTDWDRSGCLCDTTTEYPTAAPASPCTTCEDETTAAVWVYRNQISAGACVPGPAYERSPAICQAIDFRWRAASATPLGPPGTSPGSRPEVNSPCTCAEVGTSRSAYSQTTPGVYYFYSATCNR